MVLEKYLVSPEKLRQRCDERMFDFECTKDLAPLKEFIGQERAVRAVEFGLNMTSDGYNIYLAGLTGTGKTTIAKDHIERLIKERKRAGEKFTLNDWCYIYNFKEPDRPTILSLSPGKGKKFRESVLQLFDRVKEDLSRAFASEEYKNQRQKIIEEAGGAQKKEFQELREEARQQGFALQVGPMGPEVIPIVKDHPMEEAEYNALSEKERNELQDRQADILRKVQATFEKVALMQQETNKMLIETDKKIGEYAVSRSFAALIEECSDSEKAKRFLEELKTFVLANLESLKTTGEPVHPMFGVPVSQVVGGRDLSVPFQVNVFVDNGERDEPPVVIEANPNFGNMFGKIERRFIFGGYVSDHTLIKAGALSQANNGYLLLGAYEVLTNPGVWSALKRAIKTREVRIEDPSEQYFGFASQGLRPEPMPINVKIVLIGDRYIYQLLSWNDEDFWEIFKVKGDFAFEIDKTRKTMMEYAAFMAGCCEEFKTRHLDPSGVARLIEQSSRMVEDQEKMLARFAQVKEWIQEANYWAKKEGAQFISASHVQKALDEKLFRHNLIDEHIREMIARGTIMIDVEGGIVGQVNGLSVYSLGDIMFGRPSRITAQTFLGRRGVINIERESELSGPIHNKGVLILSGYLGWKFAQEVPLSLSASLCFEQSYEGVEGDSASSTELYAILSSLAGVPIRQNIAVTGSVNQRGEIQPIGGVNYKIEGFFEVCKNKGLTGEQGVIIPTQNIKNLMLRDEVVNSVREGQFHIWAPKTIDEGIEILTGVPAGERQADGPYPEGTINFLVDKRLREMAEKLRGFYAEEKRDSHAEVPATTRV